MHGPLAQALAQQMQAAIEGGGRPGRGQDLAILHVQHVGHQLHRGVQARHVRRMRPVRGGLSPVQQAGLGQHKSAQTQAHDECASGMGGAQGL